MIRIINDFLRKGKHKEFLKWNSSEISLLETKYGFVICDTDNEAVLYLDDITFTIEKKMNLYRNQKNTIHYNVIIDDHVDPTGNFDGIVYSLEELNKLIERTI